MSEHPLRIVIVGHVDHGKSTLVGRLFHDTGSLPEGKLESIQATCRRRGVPFEWAFLMDALQAERDQNITIDTAQIWFRTPKRPYVIIDAPGHREFLKNMITGAASAHAALLLIAADEGVQDQSRRHGYMLSLLGIKQVVVVVNKMDLVDHSEEVFDTIKHEYQTFLSQIGLEPKAFIPISARQGDQIASHSTNLPWFKGDTVVEALDDFNMPTPEVEAPLRLPLQDIYRFDHRRILAGRLESGHLQEGDTLVFYPGGKRSKVQKVERWNTLPDGTSQAGDSVGVVLEEQIFVERGHLAIKQGDLVPQVTNHLRANLFWMGQTPLTQGKRYRMKLSTQECDVVVESIETVLDSSTLQSSTNADHVNKDDVAQVTLRTTKELACDLPHEILSTGRFVLVDGYDVSGGGLIIEPLDTMQDAVLPKRQLGALLLIQTAQDPLLATTLVEDLLESKGHHAYVLPTDQLVSRETLFHLVHAGIIVIHQTDSNNPSSLAIEDSGLDIHTLNARVGDEFPSLTEQLTDWLSHRH